MMMGMCFLPVLLIFGLPAIVVAVREVGVSVLMGVPEGAVLPLTDGAMKMVVGHMVMVM
jgi:hypothetical protein